MSTIGIFLSVNDNNVYSLKSNLQNLSIIDKIYCYLNNLSEPLDFSITEFKNVFILKSFETLSLDETYKELLKVCETDYFGLLDPTTFTHGEIYHKYLLPEARKNKYYVIYTDEGYIVNEGESNQNVYYYYKPDFDLELLYCQNYINRLAIYKTKHAQTLPVFSNNLNKNIFL